LYVVEHSCHLPTDSVAVIAVCYVLERPHHLCQTTSAAQERHLYLYHAVLLEIQWIGELQHSVASLQIFADTRFHSPVEEDMQAVEELDGWHRWIILAVHSAVAAAAAAAAAEAAAAAAAAAVAVIVVALAVALVQVAMVYLPRSL
jgi:hypothetical protein